jgi:GAF domain-containing protein
VWGPETGLGQLARTKQTVHVSDTRAGRAYAEGDPNRMAAIDVGGVRTFVAVPMLKDGELIGAIGIFRQEVRPFTDKQIELVTDFADQAVIAIENTRLLNELLQRTNDLSEALEQQTATSEVLKVISSSPGDLEPVFHAMLENAVQMCGAKFGNLWLREGDIFRISATHGAPPAYADYLRSNPVFHPIPGTALGRVVGARQVVQIPDAEKENAYAEGSPARMGTIALARARTLIAVPLLKEDKLVGAIVIFRQEVQPFTDKQIELLNNFASQAVIANSTSCVNRSSSRLPPPTFSRSLADRRSICRPCSTRWSNLRRGSAMPTWLQ